MDEITKALKLARHHYDNNTVNGFSLGTSKEYRHNLFIDSTAHSLRIGRRVDSRRPKGDFTHLRCDMVFINDAEIVWKRRR